MTMKGPGSGAEYGRSLRKIVPRSSLADWDAPVGRPDPVEIITRQNTGRLQGLVPNRHQRMSASPLAYFRGAAAVMAQDLATTRVSGLRAQVCGDAHISNFGVYALPERELAFDFNDFDETLPGPWEWDLKRLATSFAITARHNGFGEGKQARLAQAVAGSYQRAMARFAQAPYLTAWYVSLSMDDIRRAFVDQLSDRQMEHSEKFARRALTHDSVFAHHKLVKRIGGDYLIASQAPVIVPMRKYSEQGESAAVAELLTDAFDRYLSSVPDHIAVLLRRFRLADFALKVVGVGSVGTRCYLLLLEGREDEDPFFLQIKEATYSVLEEHLPKSRYRNHAKRVVEGQRLMHAVSDSFLGWMSSPSTGRHFYVRQFREMKASVEVEDVSGAKLSRYATICGWALARAHARSGDSAAMAGYLGTGEGFGRAIAKFSLAYADQNQTDYAAFCDAIASGRVTAHR